MAFGAGACAARRESWASPISIFDVGPYINLGKIYKLRELQIADSTLHIGIGRALYEANLEYAIWQFAISSL
jgi:hypothetical protein